MKKMLSLALALMLATAVCAGASAESDWREYYNPEGYDLLLVMDIFTNEDAETDEKGDFNSATSETIAQGCFGSIDMSQGEADPQFSGFDTDGAFVFALGFAEDCEILMPTDKQNPVENKPCEDLQAWYDEFSGRNDGAFESYEFYATFEMNQEGLLTRLEYVYMP